jgi:hypothetical protein
MKFEREDRYIVLKRKDLEENKIYSGILGTIALWGINYILDKLPPKEYVVVESDWGCYEKTWKLVEQEWYKDNV